MTSLPRLRNLPDWRSQTGGSTCWRPKRRSCCSRIRCSPPMASPAPPGEAYDMRSAAAAPKLRPGGRRWRGGRHRGRKPPMHRNGRSRLPSIAAFRARTDAMRCKRSGAGRRSILASCRTVRRGARWRWQGDAARRRRGARLARAEELPRRARGRRCAAAANRRRGCQRLAGPRRSR